MINPLVSVLMTSYNREQYIGDAIKSVLNSTYDNFELLIIDDRSSDRTVEIARKFEQYDSRIKVFQNANNLGQFRNRNYAASLAKGKYLKYVDSDDLIYPTGLQVLVSMMEQFPEAQYGLCSLIQDDLRVYPFQLKPKEAFEYHYNYKSIFHKAPLSSILNRSFFLTIGGFEVEAVCGDYAFWLKIASKSPVVLMPDGIVWYREHTSGEMEKARQSPIIGFEYLKAEEMYIKKNDLISLEQKNKILAQNKKRQYAYLLRLLKQGNLKSAFAIYKLIKTQGQDYFAGSKMIEFPNK